MHSLRRGSILGLLLLAAAWTAHSQVNPKNMDTAANPRGGITSLGFPDYALPGGIGPAHPELYRLWKNLPGRYERTDGSSRLTVTLRATSPYVLFVEARTEAGGVESVERGWIGLGDASPSYRSTKMRFALSYRPDSLRSDFGCILYGAPSAEGISFASEASDCSFPLGRRIAKLTVDVGQTTITMSDPKDAEALVLTRVAAR